MQPSSRRPKVSISDERGTRRHPLRRALVPPMVRFLEQTDTEYAVGVLRGPRKALVPKRRVVADPFPSMSRQHMHDQRLLRWSLYALLGAGLGGIVGVVLGIVVVLMALLRLAHFSGKVRHWRRAQRAGEELVQLPVAATSERLCLLAAFGQGTLAIAVGLLVLLLLVGVL
jgi:hypothetical protein